MAKHPSPMELWEQARRELPEALPGSLTRAARYSELMAEHGHLRRSPTRAVELLIDELKDRCAWFSLTTVHDDDAPNGYSWEVLGLDDDGDTEGVGPTELFHGHGHTVEQALRDANWPEEYRR